MGTMPIVTDIILDWIHEDGYSLPEAGWISAQDRKFYFELAAGKVGHLTSHVRRIVNKRLSISDCWSGIHWMSGLHALPARGEE